MPRHYNEDKEGSSALADFCEASGEGTSLWDLCMDCSETMAGEPTPEGWCFNGDPEGIISKYTETPVDYDEENYDCEQCKCNLTSRDNKDRDF